MSPLALVALLAVAGDLPPPKADEPEVVLPIRCNATVCLAPREIIAGMVEAHNAHVDKISELEKQLEAMRKMKGCAKVDVLPKLKKERDT